MPDSELSQAEIQEAARLLSKLRPGLLPIEIFLQFARLGVMPIVELVPLRTNAQGTTEVLFIRREDSDTVWGGKLHTPGTVVRATDNDKYNAEAFARILDDELKGASCKPPVFVEALFHKQKRGAEQSLIFYAEIISPPAIGEFYSLSEVPDDVVTTQLPFIQAAVAKFEARTTAA